MKSLQEQDCQVCNKDTDALTDDEQQSLMPQLPDWKIVTVDGVPRLHRSYSVRPWSRTMQLANAIGEEADRENHHPMLTVEWGRLTVDWWTHSIRGLFINDFIMAARSDEFYDRLESD